jgi:protein required for attachment to host cells
MKPEFILIANASHARLLRHERSSPLVTLESFEHPKSRSKISDLADDNAGHESMDSTFGGTAYPPRIDAKTKEHMQFARELVDHLERQAKQGDYRSLVIFASSPFLGRLKTELGAVTVRLLSSTRDLDLNSVGLTELKHRIEPELAFSGR